MMVVGQIYDRLEKAFGDLDKLVPGDGLKAKAEGFMDLSLSALFSPQAGVMVVSMAHYGELNGDLMADPCMDIVLRFEDRHATPISFRNDKAGLLEFLKANVSGR